MFYVYILQSLIDNKRYIGHTSDLGKRLKWHNLGKVNSTKSRRPFKIVYSEVFDSKPKAVRRELKLKSLKGGDIIKKLISEYSLRE